MRWQASETHSTLKFAHRAQHIRNHPTINDEGDAPDGAAQPFLRWQAPAALPKMAAPCSPS